MRDRRVWYPDETCQGWNWETAADLGADVNLGSFKVPAGQVAVIASIVSNVSAGVSKEVAALLIVDENPNADNLGMKLSGSLGEVVEFGSTGLNQPGFVLFNTAGSRPCRIVLLGGQVYGIRQRGNAARIEVALFGWTFPWPRH